MTVVVRAISLSSGKTIGGFIALTGAVGTTLRRDARRGVRSQSGVGANGSDGWDGAPRSI